jgi:hypothetical protein
MLEVKNLNGPVRTRKNGAGSSTSKRGVYIWRVCEAGQVGNIVLKNVPFIRGDSM